MNSTSPRFGRPRPQTPPCPINPQSLPFPGRYSTSSPEKYLPKEVFATIQPRQEIELILTLFTQTETPQKQNQALQKEIDEMRGQLNRDSHNSSKPPSSDGYKKPAILHLITITTNHPNQACRAFISGFIPGKAPAFTRTTRNLASIIGIL
ncbi:MAG: DUF6444 domain-containing protein, partial [Spirochaetaceae bacterium]|nr:DUF6444 domain-containing protein [Spirochaetaceae bacterium]